MIQDCCCDENPVVRILRQRPTTVHLDSVTGLWDLGDIDDKAVVHAPQHHGARRVHDLSRCA